MLRKGLPEPGSHDNADLVREYANDKNGARWASIPVAVFFTKDFVELYRYVEYRPSTWGAVIGHLRTPRRAPRSNRVRGGRSIAALLVSPFVDIWAQAGIAEDPQRTTRVPDAASRGARASMAPAPGVYSAPFATGR